MSHKMELDNFGYKPELDLQNVSSTLSLIVG